ncbi:hypothetical protein JI739_20970 [Ramlibacter sp. AW1]|uniref:Uncharacterized protein n=1 Tax=Ramlibacter aurantiacus TaxID=2801330 RepID=A0A936ZSE6_9BURK|nr:hypothetical protein [Ramlibacter aurantiacus]MBL0422821.1 hypothetical protein [Ramlibacter aurantiacus]
MNAPRSPRWGQLLLGLALIAVGLLLPSVLPAGSMDKSLLAYAQGGLAGMGLLLVLRWLRDRIQR